MQPTLPDLTDLTRAVGNPQIAATVALNTATKGYIQTLISVASEIVRRYTHRNFSQAAYTEYHDGGIYKRGNPIRLREYPIVSVDRVASFPRPAIQILNQNSTLNQRATVQVTPTQVVLNRWSSGVLTPSPFTHTPGVLTIGSLATQVNALGNGWTAAIQPNAYGSDFTNWPCSDLKILQGAYNALVPGVGAYLEIFTEDISGIGTWPGGEGSGDTDDYTYWTGRSVGWRLDDETGEIWGRFPRGSQNLRFDYTAGYQTIPEDVNEATVQVVQDLYQSTLVNASLKSSSAAGFYSYTVNNPTALSTKTRQMLSRLTDHSKVVAR